MIEFTTIKVTKETRRKLKIVAARRGITMLTALEQIVAQALMTLDKEEKTDDLRPRSGLDRQN